MYKFLETMYQNYIHLFTISDVRKFIKTDWMVEELRKS